MDKETIAALRYVHGAYNLAVILAILIHARFGFRIRKARLAGKPDFRAARIHRRMGPVFTVLIPAGMMAGFTLVLIDKGRVFEFPLHAVTGILLVVSILSTFVVSRKITVDALSVRDRHAALGRLILGLCFIQVIFGLGVLL